MQSILVIPKPGKENKKVGPIPVSTTTADSCPRDCPFRNNGCYADSYPLKGRWDEITRKERGGTWQAFCASVAALPDGQLWRHNQAGDLPRKGARIDASKLAKLVHANEGKRGFTYTHHSMELKENRKAVRDANKAGFTVNLSANNPRHADKLANLRIGPVVCVMPRDCDKTETTPKGRKIIQCPATYKDNVSCATCKLCAVVDRKVIVGFPAHGTYARKAEEAMS